MARDALGRVRLAISRLREASDVEELCERAAGELNTTCGFDSSVVALVALDRLVVRSAGDPVDASRESLLLTDADRESLAMLLADDETVTAIEHLSRARVISTRGYAMAPVLLDEETIGLAYVDLHRSRRTLDLVDQELLWTSAVGLGPASERLSLLERLRDSGRHLRRALNVVEAARGTVKEGPTRDGLATGADPAAAAKLAAAVSASALTKREHEVLALVLPGCSNSEIARRLMLSLGTVKSHVSKVLYKIGARNRAEVIALALRANA